MVHGEDAARKAERAGDALFSESIADLDEATLLEVVADAPSSTWSRAELDDGVDPGGAARAQRTGRVLGRGASLPRPGRRLRQQRPRRRSRKCSTRRERCTVATSCCAAGDVSCTSWSCSDPSRRHARARRTGALRVRHASARRKAMSGWVAHSSFKANARVALQRREELREGPAQPRTCRATTSTPSARCCTPTTARCRRHCPTPDAQATKLAQRGLPGASPTAAHRVLQRASPVPRRRANALATLDPRCGAVLRGEGPRRDGVLP